MTIWDLLVLGCMFLLVGLCGRDAWHDLTPKRSLPWWAFRRTAEERVHLWSIGGRER